MKRDGMFVGRLCGAALAGAGIMYLLDPRSGRRRRARASQVATHGAHELGDAAETAAVDIANRTHGLLARTRALGRSNAAADEVIVARVRAALGRVCSHPHAVEVSAEQGQVRLQGDVLLDEHHRIVASAWKTRGVIRVHDQLRVRPSAEGIASLQGGVRRRPRLQLLHENWAPSTRVLAGAAGLGLALAGLIACSRTVGAAAMLLGAGLGARSATNLPLARLTGLGAGVRAVELQKTVYVEAPLEEAYALWSELESFPRFMSHVREVRRLADGGYHFEVDGPAGTPVRWDADVSRTERPHLISWRSRPGSAVRSAGVVRFEPDARGGTRIQLRLVYNPPGGALGHVLARLLGVDPKRRIDDDMVRFKSLLEDGKATGRQGQVQRAEL